MKVRSRVLILLGLLLLAGVWCFWPRGGNAPVPAKESTAPTASAVPPMVAAAPVAALKTLSAATNAPVTRSAASTNRESFRLSNTTRTLGQLTPAPHAILLENALVDTDAKLDLNIPKHLRAAGEPGAFIVQARGRVDAAFRAALVAAGGQIVSYIPNNAYLVQLSGAGAGGLAANPLVQAVLPYEPYFKVQATLLGLAVNEKPLPPGKVLTLGLFADGADATVAQIQKMGGQILGTDRSPFGPVVRVLPSPLENWLALAQLPGVQRVEPATHRQLANDLARVAMGVSTDTITNANWLGLSGLNVLVEVNDSGIDAGHPDFSVTGSAGSPGPNPPSRVTGEFASSIVDVDGHGTHVAGIIAGNGGESLTLTNAPSGSVTNADFRGKAPSAKLHSFGFLGANDTNGFVVSDYLLQSIPALTNALISNNSWVNGGAFEYDLSAASYDAAVRDALPFDTGPQPVLFVFAAGNEGGGEGNGSGGSSDTILSPGTAKNVITVGALEQFRDITNEVVLLDGTTNQVWKSQTDSSDEVAFYSSRGNVGVQTEGTYGRFKPDVVAPGTFVVSTRPVAPMWDMAAYYNPTNYHDEFSLPGVIVTPTQPVFGGASVPGNAVGINIKVLPNRNSPTPFPTNFPIYFSQTGVPSATNNDFATSNNVMSIPPGGGAITTIDPLLNNGFSVAVGDPTNVAINFDLLIQVVTTNDFGNTLTVLSNLNETLAPFYYYNSGTSMAAPGVSGALALMQDFFTNTLHTTPSPALLKAMLINGARLTPGYNNFAVTNNINYEGWGLVNVPNSIPLGLTNTVVGASNAVPMFFLDQSPTNVLATGDRRTFNVTVPTPQARTQKLRLTLAWTDPPGNPAAGIKLVNNLDLVVTNKDSGAVYYGNNFIAASTPITVQADSNSVPDAINNVENIWLPAPLGTNYSVTVVGRNVTVNAVTAEQTNIVQDFALVISCGDSLNTNGIIVAAAAPTPVPSTTPVVTFVQSYTNGIYFNQIAGANAPWLSTNAIPLGTNYGFGTNGSFYIGQTNQWHFYIVTNTTSFTNAAFIIFLPATKATPRMGVFEDSTANSTRPEADLNLLVASVPDANALQLTNLSPAVISNCVYGVNGDQASLARGGTKFIAYNNSVNGQVYVVGVQCQDQMAGEYGFLPIFSENPFSTLNPDGSQTVNGLLLPAAIPDGNNTHAGVAYVFALALYPMEVGGVTVTNTISHDNFGDLVGALTHGTDFAVLNNHAGLSGPVTNYTVVYNDEGLPGTVGTDGPGSLKDFRGSEAIGPWLLTEVDDSVTASGFVNGLTLNIQPHKDLTDGVVVTVQPGAWFYGYIDVPAGYTNLTVGATNLPPTSVPPIQFYLNYNVEPDFTNYLGFELLTNGVPPGNAISYGPPLVPGRYWVGLFNPDVIAHDVYLIAKLAFDASAIATVNYEGTGPVPLIDDAVMYDYTFVTNTDLIQGINVGLRVDHPRISDLVFHLISPDGTRFLLMENRGGQSTNGCGVTVVTTNIVNISATGGSQASTNYIYTGLTSGTFPITYNFYTVPDQMTVYYGTNVVPANLIFDTGMVSNAPTGGGGLQDTIPVTVQVTFPPSGVPADSTYLTIVINQFGNTNGGTAWTYTAGGVLTNNYYLTLTDNTNLTTTPIKYAVPPFVPAGFFSTNFVLGNFDSSPAGDFVAPATITDLNNWTVFGNQVSVVTDVTNAASGSNFLALANGKISNSIPTIPGLNYTLSYYDRGPGAVGFWRGESNALDSVGGNNGVLTQVGFASGEVGSAFVFAGGQSSNVVDLGDPINLQFTNSFSIDAWIFVNGLPTGANYNQANILFRGDTRSFLDPYVFAVINTGGLRFHIENAVGNIANLDTPPIPQGQWVHAAAVFDAVSGLMQVYANGQLIGSQTTAIRPFKDLNPAFNPGVAIGNCETGVPTTPESFNGLIDELTVYGRNLSASEIKAIYQAGTAGKFDPLLVNSSPAQSLAEASIAIPGISTNIFFGNNTTWQQQSISFTATGTTTPVVISGIEPGMLLDSFSLSSVSANNLYYQPEQSLDDLLGTSAYGLWQLEILDNRAGATNNATLVSWQLQFTFANTNVTSTISTNLGGTNYIAGGATQWFFIDVPTNADWATNTLIFASLPLQLWWSTNEPPTLTNTTDVQLLANSTGGSAVLGTNTTPGFITPGGHYYLGVQNTNVTGAFYALNVFFHLLAVAPSVTTLSATNLDFTSATLQASVHPGYTFATVYFEYGLTTNYGLVSTSFDITNNFNLTQLIAIGVTNLTPDTTYHFRAVATNSVGTNYGNDLTFFTTPLPRAQTLPATLVNGASAQLNGFATPNANTLPTSAWFEWGTNSAYGNLTPAVSVGTGFTVVYTNAPITGLLTNVAYHFRLVVSNSQAVAYGFDQVLDEANVVAWGANFLGQATVPAGLSNVVAVAGAYNHSLVLKASGTVVGWGENSANQATVPAGLTNVVAVAGGEYFSMGLKGDGTVTAWGSDLFPNQTNVPTGLNNVVSIAAGRYVSLALQNNGTVTNWGANFFGLATVPAGVTNVVAIAGGNYHNLALINNGTVTAWGDNSVGQTDVPPGLNNVVAIAAGGFHSLALRYDGTVVAWGYNNSGQTNVPAGLTNVVAIAAGGFHSLALRQDGSVVAWGDNSAGQTTVTTGLTNVVAISSGYLHNLALTPQSLSSLTNAFVFSLTNGVAVTNTVAAGATTYYQIDVPANADFATNTLFYSVSGVLNVWFTTNSPPSLAAANFLFSGATNGVAVSSVLSTTSAPTNIVPGGTYYLGVQNTNSFAVNYAIGVDFHLVSTNPPAGTNPVSIASIIATNGGFLLTWFAPSNDLFQVQFTTNLAPANWITFTNIISYNTNYPASATNAQFNFFDDGVQYPFGPTRFYRLILLSATATNTLTLPTQSNLVMAAGSPVVVTNTATDSNPAAGLAYSLVNPPAGATITTNGIINWPSASPAGLAARFTTIVTENNSPFLTASNTFTVFVSPFPSITNVTMTATNTTLSWLAPTNDVFQVQWTTNLAPPSWTVFPGNITSTTGVFTFVDTNAPLLMKFYQLILLP